MKLARKHQRTLERVFAHPRPGNLHWKEFEGLILALGFELEERGGGSQKVFIRGTLEWANHRPHPSTDIDKGAIADFARNLMKWGLV